VRVVDSQDEWGGDKRQSMTNDVPWRVRSRGKPFTWRAAGLGLGILARVRGRRCSIVDFVGVRDWLAPGCSPLAGVGSVGGGCQD